MLVEQAEQHLVVARDRLGAGGAVGARQLPAQAPVQLLIELAARRRQLEQALRGGRAGSRPPA